LHRLTCTLTPLALFASGVQQLGDGSLALATGSAELYANTSEMPQRMKDQIAEFTASYDTSKFKPVSFVSAQNADVNLVQFVFVTEAVKIPSSSDDNTAPEAKQDFLGRLLALFGL
jgi:X-X-X-Leu-X-X-Gly heptad repeat protein